MNTLNTFNNGMVLDTYPLSTPNTVLSNCLNGTLITKNGNELVLLNDVGNSKILFENKEVGLKKGYIPVGLKSFGGILYIFSVNPSLYKEIEILEWEYDEHNVNHIIKNNKYYEKYYQSEIGTYPSPNYSKPKGKLEYTYKPLNNFNEGEFNTWRLNFDLFHPLTIDCLKSYDGSINLIFTDNKNIPRLINTRFSLYGNNLYEIVDRSGIKDTNLYTDDDDFKYSVSLNRIVNSIVEINFDGIIESGELPVGTYTFYFKLADSDDNESDIIGQSNIVTCHKGNLNDPKSIDGGVGNENSNKSVKFTLSNIPKHFDRVYVYYSRNTSDETGTPVTTYKKLVLPFKIENTDQSDISIIIQGIEATEDVGRVDINTNLNTIDTAKAQSINSNILFYGNVGVNNTQINNIRVLLENMDYHIDCSIINENIGKVDTDSYLDKTVNVPESLKYEYYNVNNIYYRTGYWPGEYYRFGIVFILNNYTLTPVYNIKLKDQTGTIHNDGIFLFPENLNNYQELSNVAFGLLFTINPVLKNKLEELGIIGYFYTRQKRIKNILCQAVRIGLDEGYSNLPVLFSDKMPDITSVVQLHITGYYEYTVELNDNDTLYLLTITVGNETYTYNGDSAKELLLLIVPTTDVEASSSGNFDTIRETIEDNGLTISDFFTLTFLKPTYTKYIKNWIYSTPVEATKKTSNIWVNNFVELFFKSDDLVYYLGTALLTKKNARYCVDKYINGNSSNTPDEDSVKSDPNKPTPLKAAICPEFEVNQAYYNSLFTGSEFTIKKVASNNILGTEFINFNLNHSNSDLGDFTKAKIIGVPENIAATKIDNTFFSSVAGSEVEPDKFKTPFTDWYVMFDGYSKAEKIDGIQMDFGELNLTGLVRGIWGPYLGIVDTTENIEPTIYDTFNIYAKDDKFDLELYRKNDFSEFYPITQRLKLSTESVNVFNGDCYVCNFTHRMLRNFLDPEFPITDDIADPYSFLKGVQFNVKSGGPYIQQNNNTNTTLKHKTEKLLSSDGKKFLNRADANAVKLGQWITVKILSSYNLSMRSTDGSNITERAIVNKKRTFHPYSWLDNSANNKISDSYLFNQAYAKNLGEQIFVLLKDVPALKSNNSNRIIYSDIAVKDAFVNNFRTFRLNGFVDYPRQYGEIVKLLNYKDGYLICIFEHAIALIEVNERAVITNQSSGFAYIDTKKVLSDKPTFLTTEYGSQWADSVIQTPTGIYGIDTVAKKIWKIDTQFQSISDFAISKFLKDNLLVTEQNTKVDLTKLNVSSHYNSHKLDIMFTFYNLEIGWNVCFNEMTKKWSTFYSWIPSYSGNINNTFYSFDYILSTAYNKNKPNLLWEHNKEDNWCNWYGELHPFEFEFIIAANPQLQKILNNLHMIANKTKPESFHFEVIGESYNFSNDKSNMYYRLERTKEAYSAANIYYDKNYKQTSIKLNTVSTIFPLYVNRVDKLNKLYDVYLRLTSNSRDYLAMSGSEITKGIDEYYIDTHVKAYSIDEFEWVPVCSIDELELIHQLLQYYLSKNIETKIDNEYFYKKVKYGRRLGNCEYKEDEWKILVPSINFILVNEKPWQNEPPICIMTNPVPEELFLEMPELIVPTDTVYKYNTSVKQARIRDKYIKVKIRYDGKHLAIVSAILSSYQESYS